MSKTNGSTKQEHKKMGSFVNSLVKSGRSATKTDYQQAKPRGDASLSMGVFIALFTCLLTACDGGSTVPDRAGHDQVETPSPDAGGDEEVITEGLVINSEVIASQELLEAAQNEGSFILYSQYTEDPQR